MKKYVSYIHNKYMCIALFVISMSEHGVRVMLISQYEVRNFSVISVQFSHSVMSEAHYNWFMRKINITHDTRFALTKEAAGAVSNR